MRKPWHHMTREEKDLYNLKKREKWRRNPFYRARRNAQRRDHYYAATGRAVRFK